MVTRTLSQELDVLEASRARTRMGSGPPRSARGEPRQGHRDASLRTLVEAGYVAQDERRVAIDSPAGCCGWPIGPRPPRPSGVEDHLTALRDEPADIHLGVMEGLGVVTSTSWKPTTASTRLGHRPTMPPHSTSLEGHARRSAGRGARHLPSDGLPAADRQDDRDLASFREAICVTQSAATRPTTARKAVRRVRRGGDRRVDSRPVGAQHLGPSFRIHVALVLRERARAVAERDRPGLGADGRADRRPRQRHPRGDLMLRQKVGSGAGVFAPICTPLR
jgi:hypothetical protein